MPVTKRGVLEAELLLAVALDEKLLHAPGGPPVVQAPPLGGVGDVAGVQHQAQNFGLVQAESILDLHPSTAK